MIEIKTKEELQEVLNNSNEDELVVVKFSAPWCGPCRMMAGAIEHIESEEGNNVKFVDINVDEAEALTLEYSIMSIPVLLYFKNGLQVDKTIGGIPEAKLREKIEECNKK